MSSRFLVTTSRSVLLVDALSRSVTTLLRGGGLYYGLAKNGDRIYIASRRRMASSSVPMREERGEIVILDKGLSQVGAISAPFPLRDMHELKWFEGKLWITCAYENMIVIFDGRNWKRWYPLGESEVQPFDRNHLNSLYFEDETIVVLAHNWGRSSLHFFSLSTLTEVRVLPLGVQAHNIWRDDGEYRTCSSGEGRLVGSESFSLQTGGFPRGLAEQGNIICVGVSEWAERKERDFTTGALQFYDLNWRRIDEILLRGEGLVLDILPF